jgi:hypothetical protein
MPMNSEEHLNADGERVHLLNTIKTRIKYIIQSVETLLNNDGVLQIAGALYIHAVEEWGKYLYVKDIQSEVGIITVQRDKFYNHNFKIELAKNNLPDECFVLKQGNYSSASYRASYDVPEVPDWATRLTIFNTDLENGRTQQLPDVDSTDLRKAVNKFKSHLGI